MPTWVMKCSICDRMFDLDRDLLPMAEVAPQHGEQRGALTWVEGTCLGSGEVLLQTKDPQKR